MPIFKFGLQSDTISFKLPSLRFYAFGEGFGEEGECEFIVPSQDFVCIGEGHGNFALPSTVFKSKGMEIAECEFLLPWMKVLCDGFVEIYGECGFKVPSVCVSGDEAAECKFALPSTKFKGLGSSIIHGDCEFIVPSEVFSGELEHGQSCDVYFPLVGVVFSGSMYTSIIGACTFVVPVSVVKGVGIVLSGPKATDTDVVLRYEDSRRLPYQLLISILRCFFSFGWCCV